MKYILDFDQIGINDIPKVGGKNASLGEMYQNLTDKGVNVPNGFAITADAYWKLLEANHKKAIVFEILDKLDTNGFTNLAEIGERIRAEILDCTLPQDLQLEIKEAYNNLIQNVSSDVAVRSSATAEDLPEASFAGQQESYLNISSTEQLYSACLNCYASLFTNRAIKYRVDNQFDHKQVALSIGVQQMVRSDQASAGVCFTLDPETGFNNAIMISGNWGLGENVVKGNVSPDEFYVFKPSVGKFINPIISKKLGKKEKTMIYAESESETIENSTFNIDTPLQKQNEFSLTDEEIVKLSTWALKIEEHYKMPMDIEWAKDGTTHELYIVQARPETIFSQRDNTKISSFKLKEKGKVLVEGNNVGNKITSGKVRILESPKQIDELQEGEVLVTEITNPDWDPVLKKASAIVTDRGGRTSHAAIVARECGAVAIVGAENATKVLKNGQEVTISCADGKKGLVYEGKLEWKETLIDTKDVTLPKQTEVMFILADPDQAFKLSFLPNNGVGLMRMEFAINNSIKIHPLALLHYNEITDKEVKNVIDELTFQYPDKKEYFVDKLSQSIGTIAAAFYPKDVIVRMSDFKSNEYANLIGGFQFEPHEENPMLGWRGASRYYHDDYKKGFGLECEAIKRVREEMGLENVKVMIPFCRTVEEGEKVIDIMKQNGLERGVNNLEVYCMIEIPSNVILAEEFAKIFDGFSIGSNDLTQLTLGIGRDSEILTDLFDVNNEAVKRMISMAIQSAKKTNTKIGLCGQAPSDFPEFAQFLVNEGINSISFSPDAIFKGIDNINIAEKN